MKARTPLFAQTRWLGRHLGLICAVIVIAISLMFLYFMPGKFPNFRKEVRFLPVGLTGVHHLGGRYSISEFYINGYSGGNISNEGGGGSIICCVMLPESWRKGLGADIRWAVGDWSRENEKETKTGNYHSITWTNFHAFVPVEKYIGPPEHLYVHFFPGGRVRVVSSAVGSESDSHPIKRSDPDSLELATVGEVTVRSLSPPKHADLSGKSRDVK